MLLVLFLVMMVSFSLLEVLPRRIVSFSLSPLAQEA
jgi:hypothetical protein